MRKVCEGENYASKYGKYVQNQRERDRKCTIPASVQHNHENNTRGDYWNLRKGSRKKLQPQHKKVRTSTGTLFFLSMRQTVCGHKPRLSILLMPEIHDFASSFVCVFLSFLHQEDPHGVGTGSGENPYGQLGHLKGCL